jgi:polyisoprenoid-binding protein YceI
MRPFRPLRSALARSARTAAVAVSSRALGGLVAAALLAGLIASLPSGAEAGAEGDRVGFVGHNLFGDAEGVFHEWRIVDRSVDLANPGASFVVVELDLATVDTGSEGRDDHLRTADFFDVAKFPVATVRGHSARALEASAAGHARHTVRFDVDLHGVKKTLDGEVEIVGTDPVVVEGGFTIRRTDFGVGARPSRWNPMAIDDAVPVRFRLSLAR